MQQEQSKPRRRPWKISVILISCVLLIGGTGFLATRHPASLLPANITARLPAFTPYFYTGRIPAGYSVKITKIVIDNGILIVPLTKANHPTVVLTEQALPANMSIQELQQSDSTIVKGAAGPAVINDVEGRLVGTLVPVKPKALILLDAPDSTSKDDLSPLLQGLHAVR